MAVARKHYVERNDRLVLLLQCKPQQRMACRYPVDNRTGIDIRLNGIGETCKFCTSTNEVYLRQKLIGVYNVIDMRTHKLRELRKYYDYLATLVGLQLTYTVVGFNHFRRFDEYRLARRRLVVYNTLYTAFHGRSHGHNQSAVAQRRRNVLLHQTLALRCMQYII